MPNYANSGSVLSYCKRRLIENLDKTSFQFFSDNISTNSERTGAGGGTRTRTGFIPADFKSAAATITPLPHYLIFCVCFIFLKQWCRLAESNHQPTAYKAVALPN